MQKAAKDASGFTYSAAEVRKVARVQFGVFNPDEVVSRGFRASTWVFVSIDSLLVTRHAPYHLRAKTTIN